MSSKSSTSLNLCRKLSYQNRLFQSYWEVFWSKSRQPKRNLATISKRSWIIIQSKLNKLAEKDKNLIDVPASSKVVLCLFNFAFTNSLGLLSLLLKRQTAKTFISILRPKTGTIILSRSLVFCQSIVNISMRRE